MYSPFVMVLGNLISGVLFLLDEYTTSVHDYLSILTGCSLIFFLNSFVTLSGINSVFITN